MREIQLQADYIDSETEIIHTSLYVREFEETKNFYHKLVGLNILQQTKDSVILGGDTSLLELIKREDLPYAKYSDAGLYHNAILFENASQLATVLERILTDAPEYYDGSADHNVSIAFYFHDPDGNGLELYFDRPKETWQWHQGKVVMASNYIDPEEFIKKSGKSEDRNLKVKLGHIHLKVGNIQQAKKFYVDILRFEITADLESALFVSAGGYHHHIGMNIWQSFAAAKRTNSLGLAVFTIQVSNQKELDKIEERLKEARYEFSNKNKTIELFDPWRNKIIIKIIK